MTPLPPPETAVPAYIPCHPKDVPTLGYCVAALKRHPQITTIHVVAPAAVEPACQRLGVEFIDETTLLEHWFPADIQDRDTRWYYQMMLKLSVAFRPDGLAPDRYLIIDADTVLLDSFPLIDEATGQVLHPRMLRHDVPYFNGMRELLGKEYAYEGSYVAHFMVYRTPILRAMFEEFARVQGRPPEDGPEVLRAFLKTCDRVDRSFADYETYGYYAKEHVPEELRWVDRRQLNVLYVAPDDKVIGRLKPHYDFASFHAYRRPDAVWLKAAGALWLELRLLRDRLGRKRALAPALPA